MKEKRLKKERRKQNAFAFLWHWSLNLGVSFSDRVCVEAFLFACDPGGVFGYK